MSRFGNMPMQPSVFGGSGVPAFLQKRKQMRPMQPQFGQVGVGGMPPTPGVGQPVIDDPTVAQPQLAQDQTQQLQVKQWSPDMQGGSVGGPQRLVGPSQGAGMQMGGGQQLGGPQAVGVGGRPGIQAPGQPVPGPNVSRKKGAFTLQSGGAFKPFGA